MSKKRTETRKSVYKKVQCINCLGVGMIMGIVPCKKCGGLGHKNVLVGEVIEKIVEEEYS